MTSFAGFLLETLFASVVLVAVGVSGIKVMAGHLLSRDLENHKMRLKEATDRELARLQAIAPAPPAVKDRRPKVIKVTGRLFELFDDATLSIVRFALEFRAERLEAADAAARDAVEKAARLANFVRLNRGHFPKEAANSIEAAASPLAELAWRSYKTFKNPALSAKQTSQEIDALNTQALAAGQRIESVKAELTKLLAS